MNHSDTLYPIASKNLPSFDLDQTVLNMLSDPIIILSTQATLLFHNNTLLKLVNQYTNRDLTEFHFQFHLNDIKNSYLEFSIGLKFPVAQWKNISWNNKEAFFIILKKPQRKLTANLVTGPIKMGQTFPTFSQNMTVEFSPTGKIIEANDLFYQNHPAPQEFISNQIFLPLIFEINEEMTINSSQEEVITKQPVTIEQLHQNLDGDNIWEQWSISPLIDDLFQLKGYRATGTDITENKWNELVQKTLYEISQATVRENNLSDLYARIQKSLNQLMPAENMYIALHDSKNQRLVFPFFVDQYDPPPPPQPLGKGLTTQVLKTGKPLLISDYSNDEIQQNFGVFPSGASSVDWLGAPLKHEDQIIGVIAVQTYAENVRYNKRQVEVIEIVSNQIAQSIVRKQAEELQKENEERYRALFDGSQDAVFLESMSGKILEVNDTATRMYGYNKEEFRNIDTKDLVPPEIRINLESILAKEQETQTSQHENLGMRKNGEIFPCLVNTYKINVQGIPHMVVTIKDLTDQRNAEEQLMLQGAALKSVANAVVITNPQGIILSANPAFCNLTGYTTEEVIGKSSRIFKSGVHASGFYKNLWETVQNGKVWRGEMVNRRKNGEHYYEDMTITPILAEDQSVRYYVSIKQDISLRKHREKELEAIASMTTALRNVVTQKDILDTILFKLMELLNGGGAVISLIENDHRTVIIESGVGIWQPLTGRKIPDRQGVSGYVISSGDIYVDNKAKANRPFYFPEFLEEIEAIAGVPLIMQEEIIGALLIGTIKPITEEEMRLLITMSNLVAGVIYRANLLDQVKSSYRATIQGWARALEIREQEYRGHSDNVVKLTEEFSLQLGMDDDDIQHIINGAYLHDIGKMGIPDYILFKPEKLTEEEWIIMRKHPIYAKTLLEKIPHLGKAMEIPYSHHERWDGNGYPTGISGTNIPLSARIFSIVDVWDALLQDRRYRPAWSTEDVIQYIKMQAGKQFDPTLVPIFLNMMKEKLISKR
jgi:PAS domain S-box-containing protein